MEDNEPGLKNVINNDDLQFIIVGGKGGVGKTTTSCSMAIQIAERRHKLNQAPVLLISTDPAHNLSDSFNQKIGSSPTVVEGVQGLYAMELDSQKMMADTTSAFSNSLEEEENENDDEKNKDNIFNFGNMSKMLKDLSGFFQNGGDNPGIDELVAFSQLMKLVDTNEYSVVIYDTPPTGHCLRFLSMHKTASKLLGFIKNITNSPMMSAFSMMTGMSVDDATSTLNDKMDPMLHSVQSIAEKFKDPLLTTFVAVCIPEFLSLYETERLIQSLANLEMDVHNIVINFIIDADEQSKCKLCKSRAKMQKKYIENIKDLYDEFNITMMALNDDEVRGIPSLRIFGSGLLNGMTFKAYK